MVVHCRLSNLAKRDEGKLFNQVSGLGTGLARAQKGGFGSHAGVFSNFFCPVYAVWRMDLCCISLIVTF